MDDYEVVKAPLADEYLHFLLVGGPNDGDYIHIYQDSTWYECVDDDGWIIRYERDTYHFGSGHNKTVFIYTGTPRKG